MKQFYSIVALSALMVWPMKSQTNNNSNDVNSIVIVKGDQQQRYNLYFDSVFSKKAVKPGEIIEIVSEAVSTMPKVNIEKNVVIGARANSAGEENYYVVTQNADSKTSDTVVIRLGKKKMIITEQNNDNGNDTIAIEQNDDDGEMGDVYSDYDTDSKTHLRLKKHKHSDKFEGHWASVNLGANMFRESDNKMYPTNVADDFMAIDNNKSREFNLNMFTMSIGLQKNKNCVGIVSGIGINYNNYFFDRDITIEKDETHAVISPIDLKTNGYKNIDKTKLTSLYLTVPLLLEFQIPVKGNDRIFVNGGVIGAVKVSSHTKIKADNNKDKNFDSFYMNPLRYGFTANIGYNDFGIYATYYKTPFFQSNKGPEIYPFSVGMSLFFN